MMNAQTTTKTNHYFGALVLMAALALAASLLLTQVERPAQAAFPGQNGKIAFVSDRDGNEEIYTMNPDGSGQTNITNNPNQDIAPAWSPDGKKIAFESNRDGNNEIYVMNADGSNQVNISNDAAAIDGDPAWSPDGKKIVFESIRGGQDDIFVMDTDPNTDDATNLTNDAALDVFPAFSPDGNKIAFESFREGDGEIYVMNADGTQPINLSNNSAFDDFPAFSPDGKKIAFASDRDGNSEIYAMNPDGTGQINITNFGSAADTDPDWGVSTADTSAPTVTSVVPAENATGVSPTANVSAFFSEAMNPSTINTTRQAQEGRNHHETGELASPTKRPPRRRPSTLIRA